MPFAASLCVYCGSIFCCISSVAVFLSPAINILGRYSDNFPSYCNISGVVSQSYAFFIFSFISFLFLSSSPLVLILLYGIMTIFLSWYNGNNFAIHCYAFSIFCCILLQFLPFSLLSLLFWWGILIIFSSSCNAAGLVSQGICCIFYSLPLLRFYILLRHSSNISFGCM